MFNYLIVLFPMTLNAFLCKESLEFTATMLTAASDTPLLLPMLLLSALLLLPRKPFCDLTA